MSHSTSVFDDLKAAIRPIAWTCFERCLIDGDSAVDVANDENLCPSIVRRYARLAARELWRMADRAA